MHPESIADTMGISVADAERLLALPPADIYADAVYHAVVECLDATLLHQTLKHVRAVYDEQLDPIKEKYGLSDTIMSGFTLGNWVLGFLASPDHLNDMLERHTQIPTDIIEDVLPELVDLMVELPEGSAEWQCALVTFSLPLIAKG